MASTIQDTEWGCVHAELLLPDSGDIRVCQVTVAELTTLASELTNTVLDNSWMMDLDPGARRSYSRTVSDTANLLAEIFSIENINDGVKEEFGELMVSLVAGRALSLLFEHISIPISELWKPQLKQNEGFDFHTECPEEHVNFGEAKYSGSVSPHGPAISQIDDFVSQDKHHRDRPHLVSLVSDGAINNLDNDNFGVIAAFSINARNPEVVLLNAVNSAKDVAKDHGVKKIYLVGVINDAN